MTGDLELGPLLPASLRAGEILRAALFRPLLTPVVRIAFRLRRHGRPPPRGQPAVIACNHASHFEPVLAPWILPAPVHTLAMVELFRGPVRRRFWHLMLTIPVDRRRPDHQALREALRRLAAGRQILVFPEGGIRFGHQALLYRAQPLATGAAALAVLAQVPLHPCVILGGRAGYQRRTWLAGRAPIDFFFGSPLSPALRPGERRGDAVERVNAALLDALQRLLRESRAIA